MDLIYSDVIGDLSEYFSMVKLSSHVLMFLIRKETNIKITPSLKKDMLVVNAKQGRLRNVTFLRVI